MQLTSDLQAEPIKGLGNIFEYLSENTETIGMRIEFPLHLHSLAYMHTLSLSLSLFLFLFLSLSFVCLFFIPLSLPESPFPLL